MVTPAEGPSLGTGTAGQWMWNAGQESTGLGDPM
jgi:hypothetical protein